MKAYKQIDLCERKMIYLYKLEGKSNREIAQMLGRASSTIGREIKRNSDLVLGYLPDTAQCTADGRKAKFYSKVNRNPEIKRYIIEKLQTGWSPEAIAGRMKYCNFPFWVCTETIYQFIYSNEASSLQLYRYLLKSRPKRGRILGRKNRNNFGLIDRVPIEMRSEVANTREEFGHLEGDLTFFKGSQSRNIAVVIERKTRLVRFIKNQNKKALFVAQNLFNNLAKLPQSARKSITFDNGKEFARHTLLRKGLGMETYFCNPHSPWQKGQVERVNAQLHRFIPKSVNLKDISEKVLCEIQDKINQIPRKCLGFKTAMEAFNEFVV